MADRCLRLRMYRGVAHEGPDPGPQWFTTRRATAERYARGGRVVSRQVTLCNPYHVERTTEIINATTGTVRRLRKQGHDAMVARWHPAKLPRQRRRPPPEIWAVLF